MAKIDQKELMNTTVLTVLEMMPCSARRLAEETKRVADVSWRGVGIDAATLTRFKKGERQVWRDHIKLIKAALQNIEREYRENAEKCAKAIKQIEKFEARSERLARRQLEKLEARIEGAGYRRRGK